MQANLEHHDWNQMIKVFSNRMDAIVEYCRNKQVLDLGCTQHRMLGQEVNQNNWLHWRIKQVAARVVGVDYLEDEVARLNELGYNIIAANVEKIHTASIPMEKIDVIICGELIEHLSNPGLFLENLRVIMSQGTILVITTPNAYSLHRINLMLGERYENEWLNDEHKCWYSYATLKQLLSSFNYEQVEWGYYGQTKIPKGLLPRAILSIKKRINYKHISQIELREGLFFVSKIRQS